MELNRETLCEYTLKLIREYYRLNAKPLLSVLSDDCVWLGPGNLFASGAAAIKELFKDGFIMSAFRLEEPDFRFIEPGYADQLIILGQYTLYPEKNSPFISAAKQRATFCYRQEKGGWRIYHMHVSNEWSELIGSEIFPIQTSTQTYRYVKKLLTENKNKIFPMLIIKTDTANQFINTDRIVYLQATDRNCILHMLNEQRPIPQTLKDLQRQLPQNFYRIHRSFCVNSDYVVKIKRYGVTLTTGETLPIPKMRYTQVREELTALIEKTYKKERPSM